MQKQFRVSFKRALIFICPQKKSKKVSINKKTNYICNPKTGGTIAQMVEQRTENPCVTGSIPVGTTNKKRSLQINF